MPGASPRSPSVRRRGSRPRRSRLRCRTVPGATRDLLDELGSPVSEQHGEQQGPSAFDVLEPHAVGLRDGECEEGRRLEEGHRLGGAHGDRDARAHSGRCRDSADRRAGAQPATRTLSVEDGRSAHASNRVYFETSCSSTGPRSAASASDAHSPLSPVSFTAAEGPIRNPIDRRTDGCRVWVLRRRHPAGDADPLRSAVAATTSSICT